MVIQLIDSCINYLLRHEGVWGNGVILHALRPLVPIMLYRIKFLHSLTFRGPDIVIYSYSKTKEMQ